ncbi:MAG TPA: thioredoxin family protein [Burkholderiales bacterium]|nr:thioredoxin family protein [Burkholderiales bacterium]
MKLLLALLLAVAPPAHAEVPGWFAETFLDVREDVAEAAKDGKRLMLYFWLEGCPYCRQLEETTFRDPEVVRRMKSGFVAVALNVRGDREVTWTDGRKMSEKALTRFLEVRGTPTLIVFDERGRVVERIGGYVAPPGFMALLDKATVKVPGSASSPDRPAPR